MLSEDEARRIAANVANLPELLQKDTTDRTTSVPELCYGVPTPPVGNASWYRSLNSNLQSLSSHLPRRWTGALGVFVDKFGRAGQRLVCIKDFATYRRIEVACDLDRLDNADCATLLHPRADMQELDSGHVAELFLSGAVSAPTHPLTIHINTRPTCIAVQGNGLRSAIHLSPIGSGGHHGEGSDAQ